MIILLFGPPGVGKGTQADLITHHYKLTVCSTGNILREEIARSTELGRTVRHYLEQGILVPDQYLFTLVRQFLTVHKEDNLLFDGFPRNVHQAEVFNTLLQQVDLKLNLAIEMHLPDDEIIHRLTHRQYCSKCGRTYNLLTNPPKKENTCDVCQIPLIQRTDDTEEVIRRRIDVYARETHPLIDYYKKQDIYHRVSALGTKQDVTDRILRIINDNSIKE